MNSGLIISLAAVVAIVTMYSIDRICTSRERIKGVAKPTIEQLADPDWRPGGIVVNRYGHDAQEGMSEP
jgi:hypothetical protein